MRVTNSGFNPHVFYPWGPDCISSQSTYTYMHNASTHTRSVSATGAWAAFLAAFSSSTQGWPTITGFYLWSRSLPGFPQESFLNWGGTMIAFSKRRSLYKVCRKTKRWKKFSANNIPKNVSVCLHSHTGARTPLPFFLPLFMKRGREKKISLFH
jgi:hypothetical protein